jgi:coenzyme F420-0:L-glutamate ligase/coenzyme F420-1:gamma-L-glutamate ligase
VITVWAPDGVGEVRRGADLADLLLPLVDLLDGDIVCVTSKVVSKAEGRVRPGTRDDALAGETGRVVARRGPLSIVVNRLGLTMAAAGIDASNIEPGHVVLLPEDPDASARSLRQAIHDRTGRNVAVLVTDTAGRAWREGQTDIAIGAAGLRVVDDLAGRTDSYGNLLEVTAPAVADELAGVAELAAGKLAGRPFTVIRGRNDLVLAPGEAGPGAAALLRPAASDLFGLGAREAVLAALAGGEADRVGFGASAPSSEVVRVLTGLTGSPSYADHGAVVVPDLDEHGRWLAHVASYALGWAVEADAEGADGGVRVRPVSP